VETDRVGGKTALSRGGRGPATRMMIGRPFPLTVLETLPRPEPVQRKVHSQPGTQGIPLPA